MQSLQGQLDGTHILMNSLKLFSDFLCLNSFGTIFHILCPRYEILYLPWKTLCTWWLIKSGRLRKCYWLFALSMKISPVISGHSLCFTLNISIANALIFLWCVETELCFLRDFHKMTFCHYRIAVHIVHLDAWFYYYFYDCEASK